MINYSILISLFMVIILAIKQSPFIWPGVFFLLVQTIFLLLNIFLIKSMQKRKKPLFIPMIHQFQVFFGVMFPIWIALILFGQLGTRIGRLFAFVFFIGFLALSIVLMLRLIAGGDLLDRFK